MKHSISETKIKNGARLLTIHVPNSPSVFFSSIVRAGDYFAPEGKWELPHLLEHLAFVGNEKYPSESDFMFEIEKNGAYQNATTGVILVRYFYITGRKELFNIVPLALAQLNKPLFEKKDIKNEKEVVRNELARRYDKPGFLVSDANELKINKRLKKTEQQIASLSRIKREDIVDYYTKTHASKNTYFILAGDVKPEKITKVVAEIEKGLKGYPRGAAIKDPPFAWGDYAKKVSVIEKPEAKQDYFSLYFISDSYSDALVPAAKVFHAIYNSGLYSRLHSRVRKLGLSYSTRSNISLNPQVCKLYIEDQVNEKNTLKLFEESLRQLKDLYDGNYSEAELERAKGYIRGGAETYYQLPQHFAAWYEYDYVMGKELMEFNTFLDNITAVTREDITRAAKTLLKKDSWTLSLLGKDIGKKKKEFVKIIEKYF